jgi:small multidrug resistance pump
VLRAYTYLGLAIGVEIVATSLLKTTEGFTKPLPTAACLLGYAFSFFMLSLTVKDLSVGTAYALWSGIGTATVAAIGVVVLGETIDAIKVAGLALIIAGVVALNLSSAT